MTTGVSFRRLFERLAADRDFLAFHIARQATCDNLDLSIFAAALGLDLEQLYLLGACKVPRPDHWERDCEQIACRFGLDRAQVGELIWKEGA